MHTSTQRIRYNNCSSHCRHLLHVFKQKTRQLGWCWQTCEVTRQLEVTEGSTGPVEEL